jgi:single-strand DNA-binding protein
LPRNQRQPRASLPGQSNSFKNSPSRGTPAAPAFGHEESKNMAKSVNKVFLLGNVGKDPEIRATGGGTMVANFGLATSERTKDGQGNWQDRTEWHNIVVYGRLAEIVRDYVKKGSKLFVEGRLQTRNWDDKDHAGRKVYRTEIIVNDLSLLSGRDDSQGGYSRSSNSQNAAVNEDQRVPAGQDDFAQSAEISDDDIPF